jgi:voltage-gated potassium channel
MFVAFRAMLGDPETKIIAVAAVLTIAVGSVAYMKIEGWTLLDAVYFCVVTLATVGYGDLHPTTPLGRAFTILYIIVGVGIIAAFITGLAKHRGMGLARGIVAHAEHEPPDETGR